MRRLLAALLFGLLVCVGIAFADVVAVPALTARVIDQTGTLDSSQMQSLEATLAALEQTKGSQVAILIVPTTGDEAIEQYSIRVTDAWKLGRKGVDDGVLVLVAKNDHKVRIEVGRGLEGVIPDAIANRIIDEDISPRFHEGDFAGGLKEGIDRITGLINGEPLPPPKPQRNYDGPQRNGGGMFAAFFAFIVARALFSGVSTFARGGLTGVVVGVVALVAGSGISIALFLAVLGFFFGLLSAAGGSWVSNGGWGGGSSGGFGGGSGGGFSGGGGGFSGGGASGGW